MINTDNLDKLNEMLVALNEVGVSVKSIEEVEATRSISNKATLRVTWEETNE